MDDAAAVRLLRNEIPDVIAVYRFGSTAEGTSDKGSDVDLAVLAQQPLDPVRRFELQEGLAAMLKRDVDLVDLRAASAVLRMQVLSRGVAVAVFDAAEAAHFECYAYADYARLNEERRGILDDVRDRGSVYGR